MQGSAPVSDHHPSCALYLKGSSKGDIAQDAGLRAASHLLFLQLRLSITKGFSARILSSAPDCGLTVLTAPQSRCSAPAPVQTVPMSRRLSRRGKKMVFKILSDLKFLFLSFFLIVFISIGTAGKATPSASRVSSIPHKVAFEEGDKRRTAMKKLRGTQLSSQ